MTEVAPTRTDPDLAAGSEWLGGPAGRHRAAAGFFNPLTVILLTGTVMYWLGVIRTVPCIVNGWSSPDRYEHLCYSDIPILYSLRGLADGLIPYLEWPANGNPLEYPVLIGMMMGISAMITGWLSDPTGGDFYIVTMVLAFPFFLAALVATARTNKGRTWDGLILALAPSVFLAGTINWDWPAIGLTALALWAWSAKRPGWAGIALGLAIAAKFYPVLLLGPLFVLCWRAGKLRYWLITLGAAVGTWLVVNVPFAVLNFEGWSYFFRFSADRGQDFGSVWLALQTAGLGIPADVLNPLATGLFALCCLGILALTLLARRRPRMVQVMFLVLAAFLLTNKVYSPQFVLWLLPLAILARPRWRDIMWWQAAEVIYFVSIWWYLLGLEPENKGLPEPWYAGAIAVHLIATLALVILVIRDILKPAYDPVRRPPGYPELDLDDPSGGCLDQAPDVFTLRRDAPQGQEATKTAEPAQPD